MKRKRGGVMMGAREPARRCTTSVVATVAFLVSGASATTSRPFSYGPANCVTLSRSPEGNCIIHTDCAGQDTSNFDFSFQCVLPRKGLHPAAVAFHSMGVGSFGEEDELDTEVKCVRCLPPGLAVQATPSSRQQRASNSGESRTSDMEQQQEQPQSMAVVGVQKEQATEGQQQKAGISPKAIDEVAEDAVNGVSDVVDSVACPPGASCEPKAKMEPEAAVHYGPSSCVSVWQSSSTQTCVMKTDCLPETVLSVYNFGFLCEDEDGQMTRHLFGQDSFAHQETFDTQIKCSKCLALTDQLDATKAVASLKMEVDEMQKELGAIKTSVFKLKATVLTPSAAAGAPAPAVQPSSLVAQTVVAHSNHQRRAASRKVSGHRARQAPVQQLAADTDSSQDDDADDEEVVADEDDQGQQETQHASNNGRKKVFLSRGSAANDASNQEGDSDSAAEGDEEAGDSEDTADDSTDAGDAN